MLPGQSWSASRATRDAGSQGLPSSAVQAAGEPPLGRVARAAQGEKAGVESIRVAQDALVVLRPKDKDQALVLLCECRDIAVRPVEPAHAGHGVVREVQQTAARDRLGPVHGGRGRVARWHAGSP